METAVAQPAGGQASRPAPPARRRARGRGALHPRWFGFYALVGVVVVFSVLRPETYPTMTNLTATLSNEAVGLMLAMALFVPLVAGHYDLSIANVLTLSMITSIGMFEFFQAPIWVAVAAALLVGLVVGLINGVAVTILGINSLVATLATGSIALGAALWWTNGRIFSKNVPEGFTAVGGKLGDIPLPAVYAALLVVVLWWVSQHMPVGRYLYAIGDNHEAARLTGIPVTRLTIGTFVVSGLIAALAGVVQAAVLGSGNPQVGASFLLPAFAAVFLGGTILYVGRYNVLGTVVAVFLLAALVGGLTQLGVPFYIGPLLKGLVLLAAVALTTGRFSKVRAT
ncbi:ABC transporter permease [Pseudonocardia sp. H11422]|uniref:ABC transporter permease n=1 Tax=Pseudonocardia sp. H11422 TaxID=2835866 RepID=UPI001BDC8755|nr:ABC transporter permease [Pseudonocardia sp. H11422]